MVMREPSAWHGEIGQGFTNAPSTRNLLSRSTGGKTPGKAKEANMASIKFPLRSQISCPEARSVAMQISLCGRSSKVISSKCGASVSRTRFPPTSPALRTLRSRYEKILKRFRLQAHFSSSSSFPAR